MVDFTDINNDTADTLVQDAIDFMNSGVVNFDVLNSSGKPALATRSVEVELLSNYYGTTSVPTTANGLVDPNIEDTIFIADEGPILAFTSGQRQRLKGLAVGNIVSTVIHESLHRAEGVIEATNASGTALASAIRADPATNALFSSVTLEQRQELFNIIEEKVVRDAVDLIDTVVDEFARTGTRGYTDLDQIIEVYGPNLTGDQKAALRTLLPDALSNAAITINGTQYGRLPDGTVGTVNPGTGVVEDLPPEGGFINDLRNAAEAVIDAVVDAAVAVGNAIKDGANAIGNAINDAVNAVGDALVAAGEAVTDFFNDVVDFVSGNNDKDEGSSSDDDNGKPLILDLDGDGVEINVRGDVSFDMDNDGFLEQTAWVDADDAFIVLDLNADGTRGTGDGVIDQTNELVLTEWVDWNGATDLQALATFDQWAERGGNNDGVLNHLDTVWSELKVWQDANQNGITDTGELRTLAQIGITEIALTYDDGTEFADTTNDLEVLDSVLLGTSSITRNGVLVEGAIGDVSLSYDAYGSRTVDTSFGYEIQFEGGEVWKFADASKFTSPDINLATSGYRSATGDSRANVLTAVGATHAVKISGLDGDDTLTGGQGDDLLTGGAGADVIDGKGGKDTVIYSSSDAGVFVHLLNGTMTGGDAQGDVLSEIENVVGSDYADTINGTAIGNMLSGGSGDDKIYGLGGWDRIYLGDGNDVGTGGNGNDKIYGDAGNDKLFGGNNNDKLYGGAGNDKLFGQHGVDEISGGTGNDILRGGGYNDTLDGGFDDDILYGDTGSDRLIGGRGNDTLTGGTSGNYNDVFVFAAEDGQDLIKDFQDNRDKIEFDIDGLTFGQLQITNVTGGVRITYDEDDTITLDGLTASVLTESDFIF